jgi:hypothetical protein
VGGAPVARRDIRGLLLVVGIVLLAPAVCVAAADTPGSAADDLEGLRATVERLVGSDGTVCDVAVLPAGPRRPATIIASVAYSRRFLRRRAVSVLADIDSHAARQKLVELASGTDREVVDAARIAIASRQR